LKHYREEGDEVYANAINLRTLVIAAAVAMLLALGGAGIAYANGGDSEEQVTGPEAQKAKSAAIAAVGGGTVTEVERDDGNGTGAFEVEVTRDDGSQLEVHLDGGYDVVGQAADEDGPNDKDGPNDD
jgi:Peptidase propeptide and YPEB domain